MVNGKGVGIHAFENMHLFYSHQRKLMQLIIMILPLEVIGNKVIIRLDRMIHRIIQGEIDDPTGLPGQAGQ
jgi:hypothetical protein